MTRRSLWLSSLLVLVAVSVPTRGRAQVDPEVREELFGPSPTAVVLGNGRLTVGMSAWGEVVGTRWPGPLGPEWVPFETAVGTGARTAPRFGAQGRDGIEAGIEFEFDAGGIDRSWLAGPSWVRAWGREVGGSESATLFARHEPLGVEVVERSAVDPDQPVLLRAIDIIVPPGTGISRLRYAVHVRVSTATAGLGAPLILWDAGAGAALATRLLDGTVLPSGILAEDWTAETWEGAGTVLSAEALRAAGAAVAWGFEDAGGVPTFGSPEPCGDLEGMDLWSSWELREPTRFQPAASCDPEALLTYGWDVPVQGGTFRVDLAWALGEDVGRAQERLQATRAVGVRARIVAADAKARQLAELAPRFEDAGEIDGVTGSSREAGERGVASAVRALSQLRDADGGWLAVSTGSQPQPAADRPAGARWADLLGRWAGLGGGARLRLASVLGAQVLDGSDPERPPGSFPSSVPDPQGPFELQPVAAVLWSSWADGRLAGNLADQRARLGAHWPAIAAGADLLATCVDAGHPAATGPAEAPWWPAFEGLRAGTVPGADWSAPAIDAGDWRALWPCLRPEGGQLPTEVRLHTALEVRAALMAAADSARLLCVDDERSVFWARRAEEIALAAWQLEGAGDHRLADSWWSFWPAPLLTAERDDALFAGRGWTDVRVGQLELLAVEGEEAVRRLEELAFARTDAGLSPDLAWLAIERASQRGGWKASVRDRARSALARGSEALGEGGFVVGEGWRWTGDPGRPRLEPRGQSPDLGQAAALALAWVALLDPTFFDPLDSQIGEALCADGAEPDLRRTDEACGEGCSSGRTGGGIWVALVAAAMMRRRSGRLRTADF